MSYDFLKEQVRALPAESLAEPSSFVMNMQYKFGSRPATDMAQFRKDMADTIKEGRADAAA